MARKKFKDYAQGQTFLLPPSLDELIDAHHPVRIVDQVLDQIDITILERTYKGGGASSYHPRMLLKVLVYGYLSNIYSSRRLEAFHQLYDCYPEVLTADAGYGSEENYAL